MPARRNGDLRVLRKEMEAHRDELKRLAGEIRVKIHLGAMELKDTWDDLRPRIDEYAHRVEHITQDAAVELRGAGTDLKKHLQRLHNRLSSSPTAKGARRKLVTGSKARRATTSGAARAGR